MGKEATNEKKETHVKEATNGKETSDYENLPEDSFVDLTLSHSTFLFSLLSLAHASRHLIKILYNRSPPEYFSARKAFRTGETTLELISETPYNFRTFSTKLNKTGTEKSLWLGAPASDPGGTPKLIQKAFGL